MAFVWNHKLIDLHAHILPGLDDGAQTMADSIEMAKIAVQSGVRILVVTPHANQRGRFENYATPYMEQVFEDFCQELRRQNIPLRLLQGMEIYASGDVVELIRRRMLCPIAGTDHYLIEFPFSCPAEDIRYLLHDMLANGYIPIVAHPERYVCVQEDPEELQRWRQMGCVAQLNRGSVYGQFGSRCAGAAETLIRLGYVDVFGSDCHGVRHRTPEMHSIYHYLRKHYGEPKAYQLLLENPLKILRRKQ